MKMIKLLNQFAHKKSLIPTFNTCFSTTQYPMIHLEFATCPNKFRCLLCTKDPVLKKTRNTCLKAYNFPHTKRIFSLKYIFRNKLDVKI